LARRSPVFESGFTKRNKQKIEKQYLRPQQGKKKDQEESQREHLERFLQ